jgi:hypothetical protein
MKRQLDDGNDVMNWKLHCEPIIFFIHCANIVWIYRIFTMNELVLTRNYFNDTIFVTAYFGALILIGFKWWQIFQNFIVINNKYANQLNLLIDKIYYFLPYFIKFKPSQTEINNISLSFVNKNLNFKSGMEFIKPIFLLPRQLLVNSVIIFGVILLPYYNTRPRALSIWMNSNWILNSIFHFVLFNFFIYSTLIMIFLLISILNSRK